MFTNTQRIFIEKADFSKANFQGSTLAACNATGALFCEANLQGAILRSGVFRQADFQGANL
jgi:uncharacterized protein YjbI with pentapeptide repeats